MAHYVASQLVKNMLHKQIEVKDANILIMGLTFKENCPDLRNTKVIDIINELKGFNFNVDVYDPWVDVAEAEHEYAITPITELKQSHYDAIVLAVAHDEFRQMGKKGLDQLTKPESLIYDLKYILALNDADIRL